MYFLPFDEVPLLTGLSDGISSWISCRRVNSSLGDPGERRSFIFLRCCLLVSRVRIKKHIPLQYLDLSDCPHVDDTSLRLVVESCPQVRIINTTIFDNAAITTFDWCETFTYKLIIQSCCPGRNTTFNIQGQSPHSQCH